MCKTHIPNLKTKILIKFTIIQKVCTPFRNLKPCQNHFIHLKQLNKIKSATHKSLKKIFNQQPPPTRNQNFQPRNKHRPPIMTEAILVSAH